MRIAPVVATVLTFGVLLAGCSQSMDFERMRQQKKLDSFGTNAFFSDALSMRVPPTGTLPVGAEFDAAADVPFPVTADVLARGQHDFQIYCAVCHGADGSGASVMAANMPNQPPPSLVSGEAVDLAAATMFEIASHGRNRMPAYDWALPSADRWAVVAYVRMLQGNAR